MRRSTKNRVLYVWAAKIFLVGALLFIAWKVTPKNLYSELKNSYYGKHDSVIQGNKINQRMPASSKIGILIIVTENVKLTEYELALKTLKCYALLHNYSFRLEWVNHQWHTLCPQKQFMFQRHCIASHLLQDNEWTLFIDADVGVMNPNRLLDEYVVENQNVSDILFFDRFFNWEIAAGAYFAKNTDYAKQFLQTFANLEHSLPRSFTGSDNGAIHWLFLQEFFNDTSIQKASDCWNIWEQAIDYNGLYVFEACCRSIMGEARVFRDPGNQGSIRILKKGTAWMRDGWLFDSKWSLEDDFMLHGWKKSIVVPRINESTALERAHAVNKWGKWWNPLASESFPEDLCISGKITWKYWKSFMTTSEELQVLLQTKSEQVRSEFFDYLALIPSYI